MDEHVVFTHLAEAIASAETTSKWEHTLRVVGARRRVRHAKRAVDAVAITKLHLAGMAVAPVIVAPLAEVVRSEAVEESHAAAEHALPVDLLLSMLLAVVLARAIGLHLALLAAQVLFLGVLLDALLHLAVNHSAKVGLLAVVALVECAAVHRELEKLALVVVSWCRQALILIQALILCGLQGHHLDLLAKLVKFGELHIDLIAVSLLDLLLALGARHECEGDLECAPLVLEQHQHAIGVEDVPAAKLHAGLLAELTGVADGAQLRVVMAMLLALAAALFEVDILIDLFLLIDIDANYWNELRESTLGACTGCIIKDFFTLLSVDAVSVYGKSIFHSRKHLHRSELLERKRLQLGELKLFFLKVVIN